MKDIVAKRLESEIKSILACAAGYVDNPAANASDLALLLTNIADALTDATGRDTALWDRTTREAFLRRFDV